jgi:hypothetical protein
MAEAPKENNVTKKLCPVACPVCGESQNTLPGNLDLDAEPFGPVHCMVCNHIFTRTQYLSGLDARRRDLETTPGPDGPNPTAS